ncbi:MAG TPA: Flp pilus assembly protein CpaB [Candidatus Dormibacteraeota bacterium]|nr:Flp pilus assembly protein CpaB [Candidatus Dormibacteraeota bacterium]
MRRPLYLAAFSVLALAAAALALHAQETVAVVVATHDVRAGARVAPGDVEERRVHSDGVPAGAVGAAGDAVGAYVAWPLASGEPVLARMLRGRPTGTAAAAGLQVPDGDRAVAVPVLPAGAVGGLLSPGDRVDVFVTPAGAHPGGADPAAAAGLLGSDVLVLQLRSDQGQVMPTSGADDAHGIGAGVARLGSVVLAVPAEETARYAAAAASGAVYLALRVGDRG